MQIIDGKLFQSALPLRGATTRRWHVSIARLISIRAPLAGSDFRTDSKVHIVSAYFNPRSPCGERLSQSDGIARCAKFQSALPLRGATRDYRTALIRDILFQSALPLRGATCCQGTRRTGKSISIRAPLAGSDGDIVAVNNRKLGISIRAPLAGSDRYIL